MNPDGSSGGFRYPIYTSLITPLPVAFARRTSAADLDEGGRRLGRGSHNDHDGAIGDKDVLPAYDNVGGPPKYVDIEMRDGGSSGSLPILSRLAEPRRAPRRIGAPPAVQESRTDIEAPPSFHD